MKSAWARDYESEGVLFVANPEKRGILVANTTEGVVYYYHFLVKIPRKVRKSPDAKPTIKGVRTTEVWLRLRPRGNPKYDIAFLRRDLLPGTNKRWVK